MLMAKEFTAKVVNISVVEKMVAKVKETGIKEVDFTGTILLEYSHEKLAEAIVYSGLIPKNIQNSNDRDKIEYYRMKLLQPNVDNLHDFREVFKRRFKEGTICILDRTIAKGLKVNENRRSIIMIEGYDNAKAFIRMYHSSKVQPKFFRENGGKDSHNLFIRTEIDFVELFNKAILIDHPKNEKERKIIDILFSI